MPKLIKATVTITSADLRAMDDAMNGIETPKFSDLHQRMKSAMDRARRDTKSINDRLRLLKQRTQLQP